MGQQVTLVPYKSSQLTTGSSNSNCVETSIWLSRILFLQRLDDVTKKKRFPGTSVCINYSVRPEANQY